MVSRGRTQNWNLSLVATLSMQNRTFCHTGRQSNTQSSFLHVSTLTFLQCTHKRHVSSTAALAHLQLFKEKTVCNFHFVVDGQEHVVMGQLYTWKVRNMQVWGQSQRFKCAMDPYSAADWCEQTATCTSMLSSARCRGSEKPCSLS
jgi:hypothetical protein